MQVSLRGRVAHVACQLKGSLFMIFSYVLLLMHNTHANTALQMIPSCKMEDGIWGDF